MVIVKIMRRENFPFPPEKALVLLIVVVYIINNIYHFKIIDIQIKITYLATIRKQFFSSKVQRKHTWRIVKR